jgi:PhnB protein
LDEVPSGIFDQKTIQMKTTSSTPAAPGYSVVCPYIMVTDIEKQVGFLKDVFGVEVTESLKGADGVVHHSEVRIGEVTIMLGRSQSGFTSQNMTYIFVHDADAVYQKALSLGAVTLMEPGDRFYGYREGGFRDKEGHQWWVAQVLKIVSKEETLRTLST